MQPVSYLLVFHGHELKYDYEDNITEIKQYFRFMFAVFKSDWRRS